MTDDVTRRLAEAIPHSERCPALFPPMSTTPEPYGPCCCWRPHIVSRLAPVVEAIAAERAAAELETWVADTCGGGEEQYELHARFCAPALQRAEALRGDR